MGESTVGEPKDGRALYRLPPEEFTAARDALARRLRASGERAQADEVRRLRRPNVPAWALNQVAQGQPELVENVLAAGGELREAMEIGDGTLLREAERSTKQATEAVVAAAERALAGAGHASTDDFRSRLAATLRAAIVDPGVATQIRAGMLERDVELAGFGLDVPAAPAPAAPKPAKARPPAPKPTDGEERREWEARRERDEKEERERREERRRRDEARRATKRQLADLEAQATRLARQAERLAAAADRAEAEAQRARAEADAAVAAIEEVAARVEAARRAVESLGRE
jgi:hypothetical protein